MFSFTIDYTFYLNKPPSQPIISAVRHCLDRTRHHFDCRLRPYAPVLIEHTSVLTNAFDRLSPSRSDLALHLRLNRLRRYASVSTAFDRRLHLNRLRPYASAFDRRRRLHRLRPHAPRLDRRRRSFDRRQCLPQPTPQTNAVGVASMVLANPPASE